MFTIEVTFTLTQANNDIVDDFPKLTAAGGRRPTVVLLRSSSTCGPLESAAASTMLSFDTLLKDLLSKVLLAIFSPPTTAGLHASTHQSRQICSQCKTHTSPVTKTLPSHCSLIACRLFVHSAVREVHSLSPKGVAGQM
jgi:hypothetical protein